MTSGFLHFRTLIAVLAAMASTSAMAVGVQTVNWTASADAIVTTDELKSSGVLHTESLTFTPNVTGVTIRHGEALVGSMKLDRDWVLDLGSVSAGSVFVDLLLAYGSPRPPIAEFSVAKYSYEFRNNGVGVGGFSGTGGRLVRPVDVSGPMTTSLQRGTFVFDEIVYSATVNVWERTASGSFIASQAPLTPVGKVALSWTAQTVPEAEAWMLAVFGVVALGLIRRRHTDH